MEIFKLVGSIMVDSAEAQKSISKTGDQADGLGKKLSDGIKTAGKWALGVAGAAAAVGGAMLAAAKSTAENLDVIDKGSIRMGISTKSYQELAHAASLCGVEMSTMERAAKKLEGTGLNMDDALQQIMSITDEEERAAAAADLFGESVAYQMTPLLEAGADGLAAMRQEANDLGLVMSEEAVKGGAALNDSFTKITESVSALKNGIIVDLMPYIQQILDWVITNMPVIQNTIKRVVDAVMPIVKPVLDMLMKFLPDFLNLFTSVMNAITPPLNWLVGVISDVLSGVFSLIEKGGSFLGSIFGGGSGSKGSHAAGLPTVPYDGYQATLHRGETVLNANDTGKLMDMLNGSAGGQSAPINITVQNILDGKVIGEYTYAYINRKERAMGA